MLGQIIFVHSNLGLGGAEVLRETVCRELGTRGVNYRVCVTTQPEYSVVGWSGLQHRLDFLHLPNAIWHSDTTGALRRYLAAQRPAVVQGGQFNSNWHTRRAAPEDAVVISEEHGFNDWMKARHCFLDRWSASRSDTILAVSQAVASHASKRLGASHPPIEVLLNPVRPEILDAPDQRVGIRNRLGLDKRLVIGHLGTLRREKGQDLLLRALTHLADLDSILLLVGDGPEESTLKRLADDLGIADRVHWHGRELDAASILDAIDIFAFPSRSEGLGIAILEAMARGLPVVAAETGGLPEIIRNGTTGLLVPPDDPIALAAAIRQLWADAGLRGRLGRAARNYVRQNHSITSYVDDLLALHERLIRRKARS